MDPLTNGGAPPHNAIPGKCFHPHGPEAGNGEVVAQHGVGPPSLSRNVRGKCCCSGACKGCGPTLLHVVSLSDMAGGGGGRTFTAGEGGGVNRAPRTEEGGGGVIGKRVAGTIFPCYPPGLGLGLGMDLTLPKP